jgi:ADP-heptose:LPS heptosyltransferase
VNNWIKENIKDKYIILAPNTTWESKHWPELHWRSLIVSLKAGQLSGEIPAQIIIVGKDHGKAARALINCESPPDVLFAPNWNLKQTGALIASTLLLVAPDTGLLHLADFLGVQTLGLWGPTRSEWHGPFLFKANRESYLKCDCPHLYKKKHCNTQKTINSHDCMTKIISEHVYEKIRDVVGGSK